MQAGCPLLVEAMKTPGAIRGDSLGLRNLRLLAGHRSPVTSMKGDGFKSVPVAPRYFDAKFPNAISTPPTCRATTKKTAPSPASRTRQAFELSYRGADRDSNRVQRRYDAQTAGISVGGVCFNAGSP